MEDLSDMYLRNSPDTGNVWCCFDFFFCYCRDQFRRLRNITAGYHLRGCTDWDFTVYRHFLSNILYTRALPNNNREYSWYSEELPKKTSLQIILYLMLCWHFSHEQGFWNWKLKDKHLRMDSGPGFLLSLQTLVMVLYLCLFTHDTK